MKTLLFSLYHVKIKIFSFPILTIIDQYGLYWCQFRLDNHKIQSVNMGNTRQLFVPVEQHAEPHTMSTLHV